MRLVIGAQLVRLSSTLAKQALTVQRCHQMRQTVLEASTVLVLEQISMRSAPMELSAKQIPNGLKNAQLEHSARAEPITSTK